MTASLLKFHLVQLEDGDHQCSVMQLRRENKSERESSF